FNELLDASVAYLKNEPFTLYPDFQTGGYVDVSRYNDGERGGAIKVRAKISKLDNKTLVINEIPFGTNTSKLIESILKANDKGKIKVRKVDDNTAQHVEIVIHLQAGVSSDKTIDALYAFTDCEKSISPNCCVIEDNKPRFITVSELLRTSADHTLSLLQLELQIQRAELLEALHFASLEKIFIEQRIYKDKEFEDSKSIDEAIAHIDKRIEPFKELFLREVTRDDMLRLFEIKTRRFLKFSSEKAEEEIAAIKKQVEEIDFHLAHIVDFTIDWFVRLKEKYGAKYPRCSEIRSFETIEAAKVVEANEKLYVNYEEGFIGTSLKKDEFVSNCSDIDDVIIFFKDGKYKVVKVADKLFVGKNILHLAIFKRNDTRTIYNAVYRDGRTGAFYMKRFAVTGTTRDKEYDLTQGKPNSKVVYFSVNPNGEAEVIRIALKPKPRLKNLLFEKDFSDIAIKGRQSMGNILTKNDILRITLKHKGGSTLGGRNVWFDRDVLRLNYDNRGEFLGEFQSDDQILVITKTGDYYTTNFDLTNHYDADTKIIEKYDADKIWSVALFDAEQNFPYLKRFTLEPSQKRVNFLGDNPASTMLHISSEVYPRFEIIFGGKDTERDPITLDVDEFIGIKSCKAKGKRICTWEIASVNELEPTRYPEPVETEESEWEENGTEDI
ncbi:MAG: DNA gyrase/topoisomerase IV subunit A, partial [Bacteroidota bacterium]|nr:DNA gyrase/topoisomerase IV subunit A [Bacteroidota bacterium]